MEGDRDEIVGIDDKKDRGVKPLRIQNFNGWEIQIGNVWALLYPEAMPNHFSVYGDKKDPVPDAPWRPSQGLTVIIGSLWKMANLTI